MISEEMPPLEIAPTALAARRIGPWLRDALAQQGREDLLGILPRAELATHEACMNIINHARLGEGRTITCRLRLDPLGVTISVTDAGAPFDPTAVAVPDDGVVQERGYGIKIIRALASQVTYRRRGDRNELELRIAQEDAP